MCIRDRGIGSLKPNKKLTYPLKNYQKVFFDQGIDFLDDVHDGKDVNLLMHDGEESDTTLIPVSYTHLDVYKRQVKCYYNS